MVSRRSAAAQREPSPIDTIMEIVAAGQPLDKEAALKVWVDLNRSRINFQNEGKLLTELLALAPVNFDDTEMRHRGCDPRNLTDVILEYVSKEGLSFEAVCKHMPSQAFSRRTEYGIPIKVIRPLLVNEPEDEVFYGILKKDPDLYGPELDERLLKVLSNPSNQRHYGFDDARDFLLKQKAFWEARREELIPLLFDSTRLDSSDSFLTAFSKTLRDAEKECIIELVLGTLKTGGPNTRNKHDTTGKEFLQRLYTIAKKHLSEEGRLKIVAVLKAKIDEFMVIQEKRDPVEAFLEGGIPWEEVAFARSQPAEYQKWLGTRHKEEEARREAFREFGPFGMMMFDRGP